MNLRSRGIALSLLPLVITLALAIPEGRMDSQSRAFTTQFLMIGICGGYTTFSSFSLQTLALAHDGEWFRAAANTVASFAFCLLAVWLGNFSVVLFNKS